MTTYSILIVEDEYIPAHYIKKILEKYGHRVVGIASDSKTTLSYLAKYQQSIHLVIMDIKLKGITDGISLAKEIQIDFPVAILFTTAYADEKFLDRAKEINAIGYLVKPIQTNTLLSTIELGMSHFRILEKPHIIHLCDSSSFNPNECTIETEISVIHLSYQETILLKAFLDHKNLTFSIKQLEDILENHTFVSGEGAIRTMLWRLRKKLPLCMTISNVYNLGYKITFL